MDLKHILRDPRRRNIAVLAALALLSLFLAVLALDQRAAETAPKYAPEEYLARFANKLTQVTHIHIVSKKYGAFDVDFIPQKGWVLPGSDNYPASFPEVRKTLVGLAALSTIEPKTARADWYHYVDLVAPPKGDGVAITVSNDMGHVFADLIVGKSENIGDATGAVGLFVRKPGDAQSWLVASPFEPRANPADWMEKDIVAVDRARIQEADVHPANGPAYVLRRDKPSNPDFAIVDPPHGRELSYPGAPDSVASAIADFSFDNIKPVDDLDFSDGASRIVTTTFDGLIVTVDVIQQGSDYWARVYAGAQPGKTDAENEAHEINAHADRWAYKLSAYKGELFATPLESLLKPRETAKKKAGK